LQPFTHEELFFLFINHDDCVATPTTLVGMEERKQLIEKHDIENLSDLPTMLSTDPVARYYHFKVGDIVRVDRIGAVPFYRFVIP
jgi:DNA-directed RNA polymerase subunit H (RpoH/RPB5)